MASDKAAIKIVPWGHLYLVCGVNMLMAVVKALGGIDLLVRPDLHHERLHRQAHHRPGFRRQADWFRTHHGRGDARSIPTINGILEQFPRRWVPPLITSITITSFLAAFSPASTGGAQASSWPSTPSSPRTRATRIPTSCSFGYTDLHRQRGW